MWSGVGELYREKLQKKIGEQIFGHGLFKPDKLSYFANILYAELQTVSLVCQKHNPYTRSCYSVNTLGGHLQNTIQTSSDANYDGFHRIQI